MIRVIGFLSLVFLITGCGGGAPSGNAASNVPVMQQAANASVAEIKAKFEQVVASGNNGGSAMFGVDEALKKAGKPELVEELNKMMTSQSPEEIKSIAKGIIEKL